MAKFLDLTGQRFGKLTVIKFSKDIQSGNRKRKYWLCQCDCGNTKEVRTDSLTSGNVKSCGCLHIENSYKNLTDKYRFKPKYEIQNKRLYHIWNGMKHRCYNLEDKKITMSNAFWREINSSQQGTDDAIRINKVIGIKRY